MLYGVGPAIEGGWRGVFSEYTSVIKIVNICRNDILIIVVGFKPNTL